MKFFFTLLISLISAFPCFSQNKFKTFYEKILPLGSTDYKKSITLWEDNVDNVRSSPRNRLLMTTLMWNNHDTKRFKKELIYLTRNYGLNISKDLFGNEEIYNCLNRGELSNWYNKMRKKNKRVWALNNYHKLDDLQQISSMYYTDQHVVTKLYSFVLNAKTINDSILADSMYQNINTQIFWELVSLCKRNQKLPTSFDYLINTTGVIELILVHNLQPKDDLIIEKWNAIWEYLKEAYADKKIDHSFLFIFDKSMYNNYGVQYYGLLGDKIPINKDKITDICPFNLTIQI